MSQIEREIKLLNVNVEKIKSTLKENGLEVFEDIAPVSARLIVNMVTMKLFQKEIEALISLIEKNI